jgi:hypothetical protein
MSDGVRTKYCGQVSAQTLRQRACARAISSAASGHDTWKTWIGWFTNSASAMARCVASRSTTAGRDQAWYFGALRPSAISAAVRHLIAS